MAASVTDAFRRCRRDIAAFARSADRRMTIEAAGFLVLVRIGLWTLPFQALPAMLDRVSRSTNRRGMDSPVDVGRIVEAVARRLPLSMTCLVQAVAAQAMLRRRGHQATLHFGVRNGRVVTGALHAHAWLVCDGHVVVGQFDDAEGYLTLEPAVREPGNIT